MFSIDTFFSLPAKAGALLTCNPTFPGLATGAFQWERLEEDIKKKLKDPEETEQVLEKVKCILKTPGKVHLTLLGLTVTGYFSFWEIVLQTRFPCQSILNSCLPSFCYFDSGLSTGEYKIETKRC